MKKVLVLMLGLVASTASFANSSATVPSTTYSVVSSTHLVMTPERKIKLYVQPLQTKGQLAIWDANGQPVYTQNVALQKGFSQQFDVSSLGIGTYRLTLTAGTETCTRTFVVQANPNESFVVQQAQ